MHRELSEFEGAVAEFQTTAPLRGVRHSIFHISIHASVDFFEIRVDDVHARQLPPDMRRRKELPGIQKHIVPGHLNADQTTGMQEVRDGNVQTPEKRLQRKLQNAEFGDVYLNSAIRDSGDGAGQSLGEWNELVQSPAELDLISVPGNRDVLQRRARHCTRVEEVADVSDVRANNPCFDVQKKRFGIVEGRIDVAASTDHLSLEPADVDAEVLAFSQHQIMRIDLRGSRVGHIAGLVRGG